MEYLVMAHCNPVHLFLFWQSAHQQSQVLMHISFGKSSAPSKQGKKSLSALFNPKMSVGMAFQLRNVIPTLKIYTQKHTGACF